MATKQVTLIAVAASLTTVVIIAALLWVAGVAGAGPLASNGGSVPRLINYQGRLTDAAGNPLTGSYNMTFCLYDVATGGTALWTETQAVNVTYGVFNVLLGSVTPIPSSAFGITSLYLGVKVGSDSEMTPRRRVVSVGYAYRAEDAAQAVHAAQADQATDASHATQADQASNADTVDGFHANAFAGASHAHSSLNAADGDPQNALFIDASGSIGIGTTTPAAKLDIADSGTLRLAPQSSPPSSPQEGTILYSANDRKLLVYTGSGGWKMLATIGLSTSYPDEKSYTCAPSCGPCNLGTVVHYSWTVEVPSLMNRLRVKYQWGSSNCAHDYYTHNIQVLVNGTAIESFYTYQTAWVERDNTYNVSGYLRHDGTDTVKIQLTDTGSNEEDVYGFRNVYLEFLQ